MVASGAYSAGGPGGGGGFGGGRAASTSTTAWTSATSSAGCSAAARPAGPRRLRTRRPAVARAAPRAAAGLGPRDRAAPRLHGRGPRRDHVGVVHRRGRVLGVPRQWRGAGHRPQTVPASAAGRARSRSTRVRSRSLRSAPRAGARRDHQTPCKHCRGPRRRGSAARREGEDPGRGRRRSADPREGTRRRGRERWSVRRPLRDRARAPAPGLRPEGSARPHRARAAHVHRGRARRAGEGADAHRAGHAEGEGGHEGRHDAEGEGPRHRPGQGIRRRPLRHVRHRRARTRSNDEQTRRSRRSPRRSRATHASTWRSRTMAYDERALYIISVAAELAGVHPQTLRIYERKGLIEPARTVGRSRRYSDRDIALLRRIQELTNEGVGLAGRAPHPRARGRDRAARRRARGTRRRGARRGRARAPHATVATSCRSRRRASPPDAAGGAHRRRGAPLRTAAGCRSRATPRSRWCAVT